MKKIDIISYLKILGGSLMVFPLVHAFFALDFGIKKGALIAVCLYIGIMLIIIPMYNYLEYGVFWYWVSNKQREKYNNV
jgi:hypothetical protein